MIGPEALEALALTLRVSLVATLASLPVALWVAWLLARRSFPGKWLLNALVHVPLVLPPVVTGYLLLLAFGRNGPVGGVLDSLGIVLAFRWTGAALAAAVMGFPLVGRAIRLAIEAVDPRLEEAAATLGASRARVFALVTLPLIAPGLLAGAVMGFAKAMGEFGATITFVAAIPGETQTLSAAIYAFLQVPGAEGEAVSLVLLSLAVALGAVIASEVLARHVAHRISGR
jgi:molybdate transport system permease protein